MNGSDIVAKAVDDIHGGIETVTIQKCQIFDDDLMTLSQSIQTSSTLKSLSFHACTWEEGCGEAASRSFFDALRTNATLTQLSFDGGIFLAFASHIFDFEEAPNVSFKAFDMRTSARFLSEALAVNTTLKSLDIFTTAVSSESAMALTYGLLKNTTLEHLHIHWRDVIDDGGGALCELIRLNKIWTTMDLSDANITPKIATKIAAAL